MTGLADRHRMERCVVSDLFQQDRKRWGMIGERSTAERTQDELVHGAAHLAARVRRMTRLRALLLFLSVLGAVVVLLVAFDALLRREETGLRVLSLGVLFATGVGLFFHWLVPAWRFSPSAVDVAKWLETVQPNPSGESSVLATAVELAGLDPADSRFGSKSFRSLAVARLSNADSLPDWDRYVDPGYVRRSAMCVGAVCGVALFSMVVWPETSLLGLQRLSIPWASSAWPRSDVLELVDPPNAIPLGSDLQLEIVDLNPPLPRDIDLLVRDADGPYTEPSRVPATQVGEIAVANLSMVERGIEVAIAGGDSQQANWHRIDVVKPPELEAYQFSVQPPAYAGQAASEIVGRRIRVLAGSRVELAGQLSESVQALSLRRLGDVAEKKQAFSSEQNSAEEVEPTDDSRWSVELGPDGKSFRVGDSTQQDGRWLAKESISWQFAIEAWDSLSIALPDLWALEVVRDSPPTVQLKPPVVTDVTTSLSLPLDLVAADDLGVVKVVAKAAKNATSAADGASEAVDGMELQAAAAEWVLWGATEDGGATTEIPLKKTWDFENQQLAEGEELVVWVEAVDSLGQVGSSVRTSLQVRSQSEVLASAQEIERQVLDQVRELLQAQRRNFDLATRTGKVIEDSDKVSQASADSLASVAKVQSALRREMVEGEQSVRASVENLLSVFAQNKLESTTNANDAQRLAARIAEIAERSMEAATRSAYSAYQVADALQGEQRAVNKELKQRMEQANRDQQQTVSDLQSLVDQMARSESMQQIEEDLGRILQQQLQLQQATEDLKLQEIANASPEDLQIGGSELQADQSVLARGVDDLIARARDLVAESDLEVANATKLTKMTETLVERQCAAVMRRAASEISGVQLTAAATSQRTAVDILTEALQKLSGSVRNADLASQAAQMRELSDALSRLSEAQSSLADSLKDTMTVAEMEAARGEQAKLQDQTQALADEMDAAGDFRTGAAVNSAAESQDAASQAMSAGDSDSAAREAERAADALAKAAEDTRERSETLEQEAQRAEIFQVARALGELVSMQEPVVVRLSELSEQVKDEGVVGDTFKAEVRGVAAKEEKARQYLRNLRRETKQLPAFDWALEQVERDMSIAVAAARRLRVKPEALAAAQAALRKLILAAEAMEQGEPPPANDQDDSGDSDPTDEDSEEQQRLVPPLASLKLLRGLQADINAQTQRIDSEVTDVTERSRLIAGLAAQQQALGEQLEALLRELAAAMDTNQDQEDANE